MEIEKLILSKSTSQATLGIQENSLWSEQEEHMPS